MDPVSVLSLVSACLTITIRAASIGKSLHTLLTKFQSSGKYVQQLCVHVSAMRVVARSLSSWLEDDAVDSEEVEEIRTEIAEVLNACCDILSDLQDHVSKALSGAESLGVKGKIRYMWNEDVIRESSELLHQQESALVVILGALQL